MKKQKGEATTPGSSGPPGFGLRQFSGAVQDAVALTSTDCGSRTRRVCKFRSKPPMDPLVAAEITKRIFEVCLPHVHFTSVAPAPRCRTPTNRSRCSAGLRPGFQSPLSVAGTAVHSTDTLAVYTNSPKEEIDSSAADSSPGDWPGPPLLAEPLYCLLPRLMP